MQKTKVVVERDNGKWFVTKLNERGAVVELFEVATRKLAREMVRSIKNGFAAHEARELNNVQ